MCCVGVGGAGGCAGLRPWDSANGRTERPGESGVML
jgi:hypothetical protein